MESIRMGFRNIFRYRRRSLITAAAIAVGVMSAIVIDGILIGSETESSRNIRDYETGEGKIYPDGYFAEREFLPFDYFIEACSRPAVEAALEPLAWAPRAEFAAELLFREDFFPASGSVPVRVSAVDPERDIDVFRSGLMIDEGRWLRRGDEGLVLGSWLAEDIGARPGSVIGVQCRGRGGFYQTFDAPIIGIVTTDDPFVNRNAAFMDLQTADTLLALDGAVTEYTFRIPYPADTAKTVQRVRTALPSDVTVHDWESLASVMLALTKVKSGGSKTILLFMCILAAVGITNTMLMAVMERVREIGMLRALGYTGFRIRFVFLVEGFGIGLIGATAGLIAGCAVNAYFAARGLDFSFMLRDMDAGYRITGILRSAWHLPGIFAAFFGAIGISTLMAWFPSGPILKNETAALLRK